jgi:dynein heavy chain
VLPILAEASKALENITKDDMTFLKSFKKPPDSAAVVMEGLSYAFDEDQFVKWEPIAPGSMEKKQNFWDYAQKKIMDSKLLQRVQGFKED